MTRHRGRLFLAVNLVAAGKAGTADLMNGKLRESKEKRERAPALQGSLLDADLIDQAQHFIMRHVVQRAHVFFLEALAQILGGDITGFAVR